MLFVGLISEVEIIINGVNLDTCIRLSCYMVIKYEYHSAIHVSDFAKIYSSYDRIGILVILWQRAKVNLCISNLYDGWSLYLTWTKSTDSSLISIKHIYKINEIMDVNATFWHRAKVYFTCIKPLLGLIAIPNINKINTFSKIS